MSDQSASNEKKQTMTDGSRRDVAAVISAAIIAANPGEFGIPPANKEQDCYDQVSGKAVRLYDRVFAELSKDHPAGGPPAREGVNY